MHQTNWRANTRAATEPAEEAAAEPGASRLSTRQALCRCTQLPQLPRRLLPHQSEQSAHIWHRAFPGSARDAAPRGRPCGAAAPCAVPALLRVRFLHWCFTTMTGASVWCTT